MNSILKYKKYFGIGFIIFIILITIIIKYVFLNKEKKQEIYQKLMETVEE